MASEPQAREYDQIEFEDFIKVFLSSKRTIGSGDEAIVIRRGPGGTGFLFKGPGCDGAGDVIGNNLEVTNYARVPMLKRKESLSVLQARSHGNMRAYIKQVLKMVLDCRPQQAQAAAEPPPNASWRELVTPWIRGGSTPLKLPIQGRDFFCVAPDRVFGFFVYVRSGAALSSDPYLYVSVDSSTASGSAVMHNTQRDAGQMIRFKLPALERGKGILGNVAAVLKNIRNMDSGETAFEFLVRSYDKVHGKKEVHAAAEPSTHEYNFIKFQDFINAWLTKPRHLKINNRDFICTRLGVHTFMCKSGDLTLTVQPMNNNLTVSDRTVVASLESLSVISAKARGDMREYGRQVFQLLNDYEIRRSRQASAAAEPRTGYDAGETFVLVYNQCTYHDDISFKGVDFTFKDKEDDGTVVFGLSNDYSVAVVPAGTYKGKRWSRCLELRNPAGVVLYKTTPTQLNTMLLKVAGRHEAHKILLWMFYQIAIQRGYMRATASVAACLRAAGIRVTGSDLHKIEDLAMSVHGVSVNLRLAVSRYREISGMILDAETAGRVTEVEDLASHALSILKRARVLGRLPEAAVAEILRYLHRQIQLLRELRQVLDTKRVDICFRLLLQVRETLTEFGAPARGHQNA